jgi:arsenate reductase (glutaredoxin)
MKATIHHNPNCSNSRGCLAILQDAGADITIIEYLKTPLTKPALQSLAAQLQATAGAAWPGIREGMMRMKEAEAASLAPGASDDVLLNAIAAHPILLNRPIVVTERGARLCRPPELVRELL